MRGSLLTALALAALGAILAAGALAVRIEIGNVAVSATAKVQPRKLPAGGGPVELTTVTRVWTQDGSIPPTLTRLRFQFDRFAQIRTKGVPVCTIAKLAGTTPAVARRRCRGALVGTGTGRARVELPGRAPTKISSPLSLFNGPKSRGRPTLIAHAYETIPEPKALLVPIAVERVRRGRYGYRVEVEVPEIAGGYGAATLAEATLGRTFKRHGHSFGYISARCVGGRLQVFGTASFSNGDFFPSTLAPSCGVRR
ncbi:MAG: hypothetical protein R2725_03815 [Solirubrobacterales bacterium]